MTDRVRPHWDVIWLDVAYTIAARSRCDRRIVGCVIVSPEQRVLACSYNGPPSGLEIEGTCKHWCPRFEEGGELNYDNCYTSHAEMNAIARANRSELDGATIYVTTSMCFGCAKVVANSGITRVVHAANLKMDAYRQPEMVEKFLRRCGLSVERGS